MPGYQFYFICIKSSAGSSFYDFFFSFLCIFFQDTLQKNIANIKPKRKLGAFCLTSVDLFIFNLGYSLYAYILIATLIIL